jgi:hypothetical protein
MKKQSLDRCLAVLALLIVFAGIAPAPVQAGNGPLAFAVTTGNTLIGFNTNAPGTLLFSLPITGLRDGDSIVGIDIRPATGSLVALSSGNRLYVLNVNTGAATAIGNASFTPGLAGGAFGLDFNPTVDRIRLVSDAQQNLRFNPNNGAVAAVDGNVSYAPSDINAAVTPQIVASAYTNNFGGASSTTLYNIDAAADVLVTQIPPNSGTLNTVGALGVNATAAAAFDIMSDRTGTDNAFAVFSNNFYTINLASGGATLVGGIGGGGTVVGLAVTASVSAMMGVPLCGDFDGSTTPVVRASIPATDAFCRVLAKNGTLTSAAAASQIGNATVLAQGVIHAVDIFMTSGGTALASPAKVCLLGKGRFIYLDASKSPRQPQLLATKTEKGYACAFIPNTGTVVLVKG